ncbi:MAG: cell division protein ZapA [Rhodobacterales bacterium]|jgi:cell division protein ZapA|nr:cell division protein ZapA [Pseudomonadota bacterium]MDA1286250.1 cell division protein ZapA [Pseudomonadota bacterium]NQW13612.1 cell division protein ZapA [Rhodobacter sp.]HBN31899.1 cell division protein ZapA [Paracoccaceae bacterium]
MPEVDIHIGGRVFQVACQEGEEHFLQSAAALLDNEAQALAEAMGRMPESRMLLMAGLMLADKTAGLEEELRIAERRHVGAAPTAPAQIETVEVPVIPDNVVKALADIADRAEGIAREIEDSQAD